MTAVFLAGIAAGTINTVVGSGTLITFPTLLAFGVPPVTANVSNTLGLVPGSLSGADRLPPRAGRPAAAAAAARPRRRCSAASPARVLLLVLPAAAFQAIVPVLIALGLRAGGLPAEDQPRGSRPAPSRAASSARARRLRGCGLVVLLAGVYGGYFGAAQGVLLMAILGVGLTETMQRNNATKNVLAMLVNLVAAVLFIFVAHIDWTGRRPDRGRLGHRRPDRRHRRPTAAVVGAARRSSCSSASPRWCSSSALG